MGAGIASRLDGSATVSSEQHLCREATSNTGSYTLGVLIEIELLMCSISAGDFDC